MTFFYNLNKKLDEIRATPETTHKQLNERDEGKPGKNFAKISADAAKRYGSKEAGDRVAGAVRAKLAKQGKLEEELDEGFLDSVKGAAQKALDVLGHPDDEEMIKDLQRKAGVPQTGKVPMATPNRPGQTTAGQPTTGQPTTAGQKPMAEEGGEPMTAKQKAFAKLAPPEDKITFADKIAGAKKEVDEMLGDVAAEAMKNALRGKQTVADEGNAFTGALAKTPKGGKFKVGGKEFTDTSDIDEGWDDMEKDVKSRMGQMKTGEKKKTSKGEVEKTSTGLRHTRSYDAKTGETDTGDDEKATGEKRGRGRPKKDKAPERVTAKAYKHKGGRKVKEGGFDPEQFGSDGSGAGRRGGAGAGDITKEDSSYGQAQQIYSDLADIRAVAKQAQGGGQFPAGFASRLEATLWAAMTLIKNSTGNGAQVRERKLSSSEKEEREDIVKGMKKNKGEFKKRYGKRGEEVMYATATKMAKERGPGNPDRKKKEKTDETTVAGSVAPSEGGKAKKGSIVGKGIYDSLNRDLEAMIAESMNVSVNMSQDEHGEPHKNITVSAEGEAAEQLAQLLNLAGMSAQDAGDEDCGCGTTPCSCNEEMVDENAPDWPTEPETTGGDDPHLNRWAGGLNKPKETGQTTIPVVNRDPARGSVGPLEMAEARDLGMKLYAELKSFKA